MKKHRDWLAANAMSRAQFLRVAAASAGAFATGSLLGSAGLALAADRPVLRRPIPSSGEMLPVIGVGTAVVYEIESSDAKFPLLVDSVRAFLDNGGSLIDTSPTYGRAEKNLGEIFRRTGRRGGEYYESILVAVAR